MGFFSFLANLFGGGKDGAKTGGSPADRLRSWLDANLPANYVKSKQYVVSIQEAGGAYNAKITLDMLADGSDYSDFGDQNYRELAELESNYLLTGCMANPPAAVNFTLELVFGGGRVITVEKRAGQDIGFLTANGQREQIAFE